MRVLLALENCSIKCRYRESLWWSLQQKAKQIDKNLKILFGCFMCYEDTKMY